MQGLNAYSRMSDGRLPKGPLHTLINESLGLKSDLDLCAHVYGANARSRGELAQFSPLVAKAAAQGDEAALEIFRRAGQELAQIAEALRPKLGLRAGRIREVSCSGGAFDAGELLLTPFREALRAASPAFELCRPLHEPHYGAALYAARLSELTARLPRVYRAMPGFQPLLARNACGSVSWIISRTATRLSAACW